MTINNNIDNINSHQNIKKKKINHTPYLQLMKVKMNLDKKTLVKIKFKQKKGRIIFYFLNLNKSKSSFLEAPFFFNN